MFPDKYADIYPMNSTKQSTCVYHNPTFVCTVDRIDIQSAFRYISRCPFRAHTYTAPLPLECTEDKVLCGMSVYTDAHIHPFSCCIYYRTEVFHLYTFADCLLSSCRKDMLLFYVYRLDMSSRGVQLDGIQAGKYDCHMRKVYFMSHISTIKKSENRICYLPAA
jgi:hypothetical protein